MKNIALIFGSQDSEHDVSVASAASVFEHFPSDKYHCHLIYISKEGKFFLGFYSLEDMQELNLEDHVELSLRFDEKDPGFLRMDTFEKISIDAAFLMLHGKTGEGGYVQGLLSLAHIPFTGCGLLSSAVCMDKAYTHMICEESGIPMADYHLIDEKTVIDDLTIDYPCIVKPSREGSSFGVSRVEDESELDLALKEAFKYDDRVLIEEFIDGVEVGVGVLDTVEKRIISPVDQVNVSGKIFDFQEKYHPHNTETLAYAEFDETVTEKIKEYADIIFDALYCKQFARLDFFVTVEGSIYFNEVNTIPGFTSNSRYPQMLSRSGYRFKELITQMIEDVLI